MIQDFRRRDRSAFDQYVSYFTSETWVPHEFSWRTRIFGLEVTVLSLKFMGFLWSTIEHIYARIQAYRCTTVDNILCTYKINFYTSYSCMIIKQVSIMVKLCFSRVYRHVDEDMRVMYGGNLCVRECGSGRDKCKTHSHTQCTTRAPA